MGLREKLDEDLKIAVKAKDSLKVSTIRLLKSAFRNAEIAKIKKFSDDEILAVVQTSIKQRKESIEQFKTGNRNDLAEKEENEKKILESYLPPQLSVDEIKKLIEDAVKEVGASTPKDIGKVMGKLMSLVRGKADGNLVNQIVRERLK
ncbi:MAG: GatB/YqeY domain-containing protein [Candidatus Firestonebacteria bacterium]